MKIIFAGTPEFAAVALQALHAAGHDIPLVLTQPDRPAGRGLQLHPSAVKQWAASHGIAVTQPPSLKLDGKHPDSARAAHDLLLQLQPDLLVVAAYGLILPRSILEIPRHGCLNIHASLLPRWRGAAPIHRAIEAGDTETGVTLMQMDEGLDTGAMLGMQRVAIAADDTTGSLHDKLARLGGAMVVEAVQRLAHGALPATPQPLDGVTYAAKIDKEEALVDFAQPAAVVARKIRSLNPFPGAAATFNGIKCKLWHAQEIFSPTQGHPGQILQADAEAGVIVACGSNAVRITELQKPGGKRLPAGEFLKGFSMRDGQFDLRD